MVPVVPKVLESKANGEDVVPVNVATLGLKSRVSDALTLFSNIGTSLKNLLSSYDATVNISPLSLSGTL